MTKHAESKTEVGTAPTETAQNPMQGATIPTEPQGTSAAGEPAEDTLKAYQALFEKQQAELAAEKERTKSLQNQINILMRNGGHVPNGSSSGANELSGNDTSPQNSSGMPNPANGFGTFNSSVCGTEEPQEPYVSLTDLGAEVGKRNYRPHNIQRED